MFFSYVYRLERLENLAEELGQQFFLFPEGMCVPREKPYPKKAALLFSFLLGGALSVGPLSTSLTPTPPPTEE